MKDDLNTLEKGGDGKKQEKARTDFFFCHQTTSTVFILGPRGPLQAADQHEVPAVQDGEHRPTVGHRVGAAQPGDVQHRPPTPPAQKPAQVMKPRIKTSESELCIISLSQDRL